MATDREVVTQVEEAKLDLNVVLDHVERGEYTRAEEATQKVYDRLDTLMEKLDSLHLYERRG